MKAKSSEPEVTPSQEEQYEVGYGKPPKTHQFRKGRSGNPRGRPKQVTNTATLLDEALDETAVVVENGHRTLKTKRKILFTTMVNSALKGNFKQAQMILKNLQEREQENPERGTSPVVVILPDNGRDSNYDAESNRKLAYEHGLTEDEDGKWTYLRRDK